LTTYAEAIIYGMVRLAFPPQWDIKIDLDYKQKNRSDGHIADHFIVSMNFVSSNISIEEMRLLETLQVKQKLLLAAMTAAQAEHDKAAKLLANHIDSVTYASRLQKNLLVPNDLLDKRFSEFQAIWEPREIVGGDIYWTTPDQDPPLGHFSLALFDCTGHGVPGAMLSLLVTSAIDRIYANDPNVSPDAALISVDEALRSALHKRGSSSEIDDGCDAAIVRIYPDKRTIEYAGAKLGLIRVSKGNEHEIIQPVRVSLGYQDVPISVPKLNALSYESGDVFAMVTDGFTDQVGGPQPIARSYGYKRILESIANNSDKSVAEIIRILKEDFDHWQGNQLRRDDLTVLIFRP
jgi:phosphoserine phosphatase RsbU/P